MAAYIGLVANALSIAVTIKREVDRDEKEWKVVMDKVGRISSLLDNVGKSCVNYNLREDDLPEPLCNILREMTTKLDELRRELTQGRGVVGKVLSRDYLKMKVQQCDRELSDLIQYFLSELLLDARLAQIADARRNQSWPAQPGEGDWDSSPQIHQQSPLRPVPSYGGQGYDGHRAPYGMVDPRTPYVQQQPQPHTPAYPNNMMMTTEMSWPREPQPSGGMSYYPSNSAVVAGASRIRGEPQYPPPQPWEDPPQYPGNRGNVPAPVVAGASGIRVKPQYPPPQPWEYPPPSQYPGYRGNVPAPATDPAASVNWSAHQ